MQYPVTKLFHRMKRRAERFPGRPAVFFRKKGKLVQFFGFQITAFRLKKAAGRKACEILLAGLELFCPQYAHGPVSPMKWAGITLP